MKERLKLVMATNNAAKLREARAIAGENIEILSLADVGFHQDIPETADTLEGNALIKARAVKEATGLNCFADDTGLMVDALGGAPGVYSARYAGEQCDPNANIDLLLANLEGAADRRARFATAIALSLNGEEHLFRGVAEGAISPRRCGDNGFGYDPVFISEETGRSFAEMTDVEKNSISHRGRALQAMMRWLAALSIALLACLNLNAANADWRIHTAYGDKVDMVFDTPDKAYYLVFAQPYAPDTSDNDEILLQLFCLEKESDEVRPYNSLNFLSGDVIKKASYNALRRYLLLVYDDLTIDLLFDDGRAVPITGLKNYSSQLSKNVRAISFDAANNRAYLATDFGFIAIDDKKGEIAESGIFGVPVDNMVRTAGRLIMQREGKLYSASASGPHSSLADFRPEAWAGDDQVLNLVALSPSKCIFSKTLDGTENHYILDFEDSDSNPKRSGIGSFEGADIAENRDGLLLTRTAQIVEIDRTTGALQFIPRRHSGEDYAVKAGSWDSFEIFYALPFEGIYSVKRNDKNEYRLTRDLSRPNAPAPFRTDNFLYVAKFGMLANTHGINQNFDSHLAQNPVLLSSLKDGDWTMHGIPYLKYDERERFINPSGIAQDPDIPEIFYMGSTTNGLLSYNISDYSDLLHITRSNDNRFPYGHVSAAEPYPLWPGFFPLLHPRFDRQGNLVMAHIAPRVKEKYSPEIWVWTAEDRKASSSPETFKPMKRLPLEGFYPQKSAMALPLALSKGLVVYLPIGSYKRPIAIYDHKTTISDDSDDRQALMKDFYDADGKASYEYFYCMMEDPSTGIVWVGTNDGVFTFDPADAFSSPGKINRIKVSRNDGTSLADYLLAGSSVNNIAADGRGRKWFSLNGGGIVVTSADGHTILQEINSDNSPLPSDIVYASAYNPASNSMMIGTSAGIAEYFLPVSGGKGESGSAVKVYPNPVAPDYYGYVTIEGLEDDALVKIVDAAGKVVREVGPASGGKALWDAAGVDLKRVGSGVYYILASSGSSEGNFSEVGKVLVMNR